MNDSEMLGKERVGKLLFKLALPSILAQLINVLYNVVDRLYIAGLKDDAAMSGLTVCFPILMIVAAFTALVGMGGAPLASISMGKGDRKTAEKYLGNSFVLLVAVAAILTVVVEVFQKGILDLFGATPSAMQYGKDYITIYMIGTLSVQLSLGLNAFISAQGFAKTSMATVVIGAVCNIILDPIFIFGLKMGIKGAALATILSQTVSAVWVVAFLCGKKSVLKLRFKNMRVSPKLALGIVALGVSPFIMQATESLVQMTFNTGLRKYSADETQATAAIAGMGVLFTVMQMTAMPLTGLAQGAQPIISYNYGALRMDRVRKTFKLLLISAVIFCGVIYTVIMSFPIIFARPLATSPESLSFATRYLRIFMAGAVLFSLQFSCQQSLVALGQAKISLFLALFRKVILLVPLAIVFPMIFKENKTVALIAAEPVADVTAACVTTLMFVLRFRSIDRRISAAKAEKPSGSDGLCALEEVATELTGETVPDYKEDN